jgi:GT2 family glycosyltransferase
MSRPSLLSASYTGLSQRVQPALSGSIASVTVSVVIPVYRGGAAFERCLASLAAYLPAGTEVVIVVDGQDAASAQMAHHFRENTDLAIKITELPRNYGPAYARNVGAQAARGDLLFFVDADVAILPHTMTELQRAFEQHPAIAALIGSYDDAPGSANFLSQYKNLLHHYTHQIARTEASTFWGACGAIRREVFLAIGGFDETYRDPCVEDIELGYRLKRSGYRIRLAKAVQVKHLKRWGVRSLLRAEIFYRAIPWTELIWRDRSFVSDLNLDTGSRLSVISVYGIFIGAIASLMWGQALFLVLLCSVVLCLLNAPVYRFLQAQRGLGFMLQSIPWHWLYYAYSGLGFVIGTSRYWCNRDRWSAADRTQIAVQPIPLSYDLLPNQQKH